MTACRLCNGTGRRMVPCPDGRPGCLVAHYGPCDHDARSPEQKEIDILKDRLDKLERNHR